MECITQSYLLHIFGVFVLRDLRIDVEQDRHPHFLSRLQRLLCEAETLDLVEIFACLFRLYIEARLTGTSPTMKNISKPALLDIRFPLPDVGTQHRLVREIESARKIAASKRSEAITLRQSAWATFESALFTASEKAAA